MHSLIWKQGNEDLMNWKTRTYIKGGGYEIRIKSVRKRGRKRAIFYNSLYEETE